MENPNSLTLTLHFCKVCDEFTLIHPSGMCCSCFNANSIGATATQMQPQQRTFDTVAELEQFLDNLPKNEHLQK